jgi:hypothetical protein
MMVVMVQLLRDAFTAQLLFRLNGGIDACVEFGFRVNEEGTTCSEALLLLGLLCREGGDEFDNAYL